MNTAARKVVYQFRYFLPVWFATLLTAWLPDNRFSIRIRGALVSLFLPGRPRHFLLGRDVTLLGIHALNIGSHVYLAKGCWINAHGTLTIEDEVKFSPYVVVATTNHGFRNGSVTGGGVHYSPVSIGPGSWIGSHSTITAGVSIGTGTVVGANSVVTKDIGDNLLVGGVPAKIIRLRNEESHTST